MLSIGLNRNNLDEIYGVPNNCSNTEKLLYEILKKIELALECNGCTGQIMDEDIEEKIDIPSINISSIFLGEPAQKIGIKFVNVQGSNDNIDSVVLQIKDGLGNFNDLELIFISAIQPFNLNASVFPISTLFAGKGYRIKAFTVNGIIIYSNEFTAL